MEPSEAARILGVALTASPVDIERAFRRLAHVHHPDRGGDSHALRQLILARSTLASRTRDSSAQDQQIIVVARSRLWRRVIGTPRRLRDRRKGRGGPPRVQ